ncbi:hypothetical protein [Brevibacillus migulae]|uniref:hypothetical protein n=1 Tax=Brevibacillus migulae TaxID=1644114 RepID=UPI00106E11B3|nr:hypothetical protein [Brevibacillus migulae]
MKIIRNNYLRWLPLLFAAVYLSLLIGCTPEPVGAMVTLEEAKAIASNEYGVKEIKSSELRHLDEKEIQLIPEEGKEKTPVYYVIHGVNDAGEKIVVYVSSNDQQISFILTTLILD